jgi:hypothetical protein
MTHRRWRRGVDLVPKEAGTIVHLRILSGLFGDYEALVQRSAGRMT